MADVFWTFQGLSSSLWSLITMTEGVSALMSPTIWLPLLSHNYFSLRPMDTYHILSLALCGTDIDSLKWAFLSVHTCSLCFSSCCSSLCSQYPLLAPYHHLCLNINVPGAVLHAPLILHIPSSFETLNFLSSPIICLSSMFSNSFYICAV